MHSVNGITLNRTNGLNFFPDGDLTLTYSLGTNGSKTVRFSDTGIVVNVTHSGAFKELLPFAHATNATVTTQGNRVQFVRPGGASCTLTLTTPGTFSVSNSVYHTTGMSHRMVTVTATNTLGYILSVNSPGAVLSPDVARTEPGTPVTIPVLANDAAPTNTTLTVVGAGPSTLGTVTFTSSAVTVLPTSTLPGTNVFPYVVSDGSRLSTSLVTLVIATNAYAPFTVRASSWQDPNVPANVIDADLNTRWSAQSNGQWIELDLHSPHLLSAVQLASYVGNTRIAYFDVQLSPDGTNWFTAYAGGSSGTTLAYERFNLADTWTRYVRFLGRGNSTDTNAGWNSYTGILIENLANLPPVAGTDTVTTGEHVPVLIPILDNDTDPDAGPQTLNVSSVSSPAHGSFTLLTNALYYTPDAGFVGTDTVTYTVFDGGRTATGLVTVAIPYPGTFAGYQSQHWSVTDQTNAAVSGLLTDPNGNGLPNLLEYAFAGDPLAPGLGPVPQLTTTNDHLALIYIRRTHATDLTYLLEHSTNLLTWLPVGTNTELTVLSTNAESEVVQARLLTPMSAAPGQFLRVRVESGQ